MKQFHMPMSLWIDASSKEEALILVQSVKANLSDTLGHCPFNLKLEYHDDSLEERQMLDQSVMYITDPSNEDVEKVKGWIRQNQSQYEDSFDMAVECAHDLGIFELDAVQIDPKADRDIPEWIGNLCQQYFSKEWT